MDDHFRLITGSIIAFNFAVIIGVITNINDTLLITIALSLASIGFPVSIGAWVINQSDDTYPGNKTWSWLLYIGALCGITSMSILIYSKSIYAGTAFVVTSIATVYFVADYMRNALAIIKATNKSSNLTGEKDSPSS